MKLEKLVARFAENVAAQTEALERGKTGNVYARRYIAAFTRLRECGNIGRDALATLLTHERADVRITAAACLLRHCGERAVAVLEKEAAGKGLTAFVAAQSLARWREGKWQLDPE